MSLTFRCGAFESMSNKWAHSDAEEGKCTCLRAYSF